MYGEKPVDHPLGYLVAFGGFLVQFAVFGTMNSFTIFLDNMMNDETLGYPTQTSLSLGNSLSMGLTPAFGLLAGYLSDRVHPRILLLIAIIAALVGLLLSSFLAKTGIQLSLYFSIPLSFSAGMMFTPATTAISTWFDKHRSTAIGIVFSGGGCGSVIFPLYCEPFLDHYGWRITFRLLLALVGSGIVGALLVEKRINPETRVETESDIESMTTVSLFPEEKTFRNTHMQLAELLRFLSTPLFILSFICQILYSFTFYSIIYIPVPMALTMGKKGTVYHNFSQIDSAAAGRLMIWFGIAQIAGSSSSGLFSTYMGCEAVFCICCSIASITCCLLALSNTYIQLSFAVAVIAFSVSGMLSTYPSILAKIFHGANLGTSMSLVFLAGCISGLSAPPAQSAMQNVTSGDYTYGCILSSGTAIVAAYICYFFLWRNNYEMMLLKREDITPINDF